MAVAGAAGKETHMQDGRHLGVYSDILTIFISIESMYDFHWHEQNWQLGESATNTDEASRASKTQNAMNHEK